MFYPCKIIGDNLEIIVHIKYDKDLDLIRIN